MPEGSFGLGSLSERVPELRGALVFELSGIEVASWGEADPELNSAELAELVGSLGGVESLQLTGRLRECRVAGESGQWLLFALGSEYVLALLTDAVALPGRVRFYAAEWMAAHRRDFA